VDDNATQREILDLELRACGIRCATAASGAEALARFDAGETFDAAILDRGMPEMDGVALAGAIRARGARLPLVLLIAAAQGEDAVPPGAFAAVLKKPVKRSKLHHALARVLSLESGLASDRLSPPTLQFDAGLANRLPLRILLAEDSPTNQRIALLMLRRMGYEADVAENGLEVLAALERRRYDLVLMDVEMPQMDGVEATRRIRAQAPRDAQPRILGLTANASPEDRDGFLAAGMDACLVKPVRPAELQAALESCAVFARSRVGERRRAAAEG
jgi:CheY-like chemotaxis protein